MSRRILLPLLALAVLIGGFFGLRAALQSDGGPSPESVSVSPGDGALSPRDAEAPLPEPRADEAPLPAAGTMRAAATTAAPPEGAEAFSLEDARWIEGRVLFPIGAAPEPELAVVAVALADYDASGTQSQPWRRRGNDWRAVVEDSERWSRRTVAADGSFRLPLPNDAGPARLYLDGRFLYLPEPVEVDLAAPEAVDLQAELGGAIAVRVVPPRNVADAAKECVGAEVELTGSKGGGMFGMMGGGALRREVELLEELETEFGGLPADHTYYLAVDPQVFLGVRELDVEIEAGQVTVLEIALETGATIAGRVIDDSGAAVEGARVAADLSSRFGQMAAGADRSVDSGADGSFRLRGVQPRKLTVKASKDGLVRAESEELKPAQGQVINGVELVLQRGATIAGVVRYDDGSPAPEVTVHMLAVRKGSEEPVWGERQRVESEADGSFSRSGLRDEYTFEVTAIVDDDAERDAGHRARVNAVAPGTRGLELLLAAPKGLAGLVRSEAGEPLEEYSIRARLEESEVGRSGSSRVEVDDPDGRFLLPGVFEGSWKLTVEAEGWVTKLDEVEVTVPSPEAVEVVMVRASSIAGLVLDPTGEPAAGATVRLDRGAARSGGGGGPFGGFSRADTTATADEAGQFLLADLRPGKVRLSASDESWAPAAEQALELLVGTTLDGITLQLTNGGTLTGEIFDAEGNPDPGRSINVFNMGGGGGGMGGRGATSDEAGSFIIEHLAPGSMTVMAQPRISALAEMAESDEDLSPVDFMSSMKMKTVEIVDNQETHVVLGEPPANPVRLFGRVTEGGQAIEKGTIMALAEGRSIIEAWKPARVSSDGTYEVTLDEPGRYILMYQAEAFQEGGIEFPVTVPEAAEHRFDMKLPGGGITGTVYGPDGAPLAEVSVSITHDSSLSASSIFSMGRRARSGEDGRFTFDRLEAGSYSLRAGGQSMPGRFGGGGGAAKLGTTLVSDLTVIDGEQLTGVELRLSSAGRLVGTVTGDDGAPVADASVFVRDEGGRLVQSFSTTATDADGRFEHSGLAPGDYTISARTTEAVTSGDVSVRVREDDESEVQLRVESGVMVRVVAETPEGDPARATVSVIDEDGREHATLRSMASLTDQFTEGLSTSEIRIGPVPPGKYAVTVTSETGQVEERNITLKASRSERKLRLRFDE